MSEDEQQGAEDQPAADASASAGSGQNGEERRPARKRVIEVGWLIDGGGPSFLWQTPKSLHQAKKPPEHPKAVDHCPAIVDGEARTIAVAAPIDLHIRLGADKDAKPTIVNAAGLKSQVTSRKLDSMVTMMAPNRWRHPKRPVLQFIAPYRFLCDEPCWMNQLPPYYDYKSPPWPGVMIGGRFPIHNWPRSLMWAFEWRDTARDLIVRRGEPWFYVRFETEDPSRPMRLIEAEMTPELREFCKGLDGVTNYVNRTFSLMEVAAERRPARLLYPKREDGHGAAAASEPDVADAHAGD